MIRENRVTGSKSDLSKAIIWIVVSKKLFDFFDSGMLTTL